MNRTEGRRGLRPVLVGCFRALLNGLAGGCVIAGPFRGMRYVRGSQGSVYNAKILGTYEMELHPVVERLRETGFGACVDIGAGEGFYAVGLARLLGVRVTAFEMDEGAHPLIRAMAIANGLEARVGVHGRCDVDSLSQALGAGGGPARLVVCDVEGFEGVLLDPGRIPALRAAHMLVEVHDCFQPGVGNALLERFAGTHKAVRIDAKERTPADFPRAAWWRHFLPASLQRRLMSEGRPEGMYWLWMVPCPG